MDLQVKRVVVGVDDTPGGLTTLRRGWEEARRLGAELHLVHAFGGSDIQQYGPAGIGIPEVLAAQRRQARMALQQACVDALGRLPEDLPVAAHVFWGKPGAVLTAYVDDSRDLLVVGTGSAGTVRRIFTYSVTAYCFRHAPCPVLGVPGSPLAREYRKGIRRWNGWIRRQADTAAETALNEHVSRA